MESVNAQEIRLCYGFACHAWNNKTQSTKDFGNAYRKREDFIADQMSGKIAEIIFKKQVERTFPWFKVDLNFLHYMDPLHTDNGDVAIIANNNYMPVKIDIKSSSYRANWLPIEDYKYRNRETHQIVSDYYVMVKFDLFMPTSSELRSNPEQLLNFNEVRGEIIGWVKHDDLECPYDGNPWFIFNHGDQFLNTKLLPSKPTIIKSRKHLTNYINKVMSQNNLAYNIGPRLKAQQNISFPIKWLNTNLGSLFDQILNQA